MAMRQILCAQEKQNMSTGRSDHSYPQGDRRGGKQALSFLKYLSA